MDDAEWSIPSQVYERVVQRVKEFGGRAERRCEGCCEETRERQVLGLALIMCAHNGDGVMSASVGVRPAAESVRATDVQTAVTSKAERRRL